MTHCGLFQPYAFCDCDSVTEHSTAGVMFEDRARAEFAWHPPHQLQAFAALPGINHALQMFTFQGVPSGWLYFEPTHVIRLPQ